MWYIIQEHFGAVSNQYMHEYWIWRTTNVKVLHEYDRHVKVFPQVILSVPMWYTIRSLINTCSMNMNTHEKVLHEYVINACKCIPSKGDDVATESIVNAMWTSLINATIKITCSQNLVPQICWIISQHNHSESIQHKYSQSIQQKYKGFNKNTKYSTQL